MGRSYFASGAHATTSFARFRRSYEERLGMRVVPQSRRAPASDGRREPVSVVRCVSCPVLTLDRPRRQKRPGAARDVNRHRHHRRRRLRLDRPFRPEGRSAPFWFGLRRVACVTTVPGPSCLFGQSSQRRRSFHPVHTPEPNPGACPSVIRLCARPFMVCVPRLAISLNDAALSALPRRLLFSASSPDRRAQPCRPYLRHAPLPPMPTSSRSRLRQRR
jgi:hypothetical protein